MIGQSLRCKNYGLVKTKTETDGLTCAGRAHAAPAQPDELGNLAISEIGTGEIETPNANAGLNLLEFHAKLKKRILTKTFARVSRPCKYC